MLKKITPSQAAQIMGCSYQFVRVGLQLGKLDIGDAIQINGSGRRWTYNISPAKLAARQGITVDELERKLNEKKN